MKGATLIPFPLARRGMTFKEWLVRQRDHAAARGHCKSALAFDIALLQLSGGNLVRSVNAIPCRFRSAARALAAQAIARRAAVRRCGRRVA